LVEFFVQGGDFGFDVLANAGGVVVHFDGECLRREAMSVMEPPVVVVVFWRRMPRRKSRARGRRG
jgi:hypothetical protein